MPAIFVFGGFIFRIRETSHKTFTFTFVFLGLYAIYRLLEDDSDPRFAVVAGVALFAVSFTNFIWGVIYGGAIVAALFLSRRTGLRYGSLSLIPLIGAVVATRLSTTRITIPYFENTILGPLQSLFSGADDGGHKDSAPEQTPTPTEQQPTPTEQTPGGGQSADGPTVEMLDRPGLFQSGSRSALNNINDWPSVAGVSSWFIAVAGIFVVAGLSAASLALAAVSFFRRRSTPLGKLFLAVSIALGSATVVLYVVGDFATLKRTIVVPGILGTLYWTWMLSQDRLPEELGVLSHRRDTVLKVTFVVLLLGSILAVPRATLDEQLTPYDMYADRADQSKIEWAGEFGSDCVQTHQQLDDVIAAKLDTSPIHPVPYRASDHLVYDAGGPAILTCGRHPPDHAN
ncbi:hypothetical protein [Halorhabdus rudnickae]|uniref:hypothetical protein n=1 Tax=Halorhabdus rudnickae TaxID=1775544 RepID=UPI00108363C2|nr:hypothetical protein [Halorhabdus rudnickae]